MTKYSFSIICFLLILFSVNGQTCKYKSNGVDKFTNKYIKWTKTEKVVSTSGPPAVHGELSIRKIDTAYSFILDYTLSKSTPIEQYSINFGAQLLFLLENGETVTLKSKDNINGVLKTVKSVGTLALYYCNLTNVDYPISSSQINLLLKYKIKTIRFYRTEPNGKEDFVDDEVKTKLQDNIQELIKCVI